MDFFSIVRRLGKPGRKAVKVYKKLLRKDPNLDPEVVAAMLAIADGAPLSLPRELSMQENGILDLILQECLAVLPPSPTKSAMVAHFKALDAAQCNDFRTSYAMARALGAPRTCLNPTVKKKQRNAHPVVC